MALRVTADPLSPFVTVFVVASNSVREGKGRPLSAMAFPFGNVNNGGQDVATQGWGIFSGTDFLVLQIFMS